MPTPSYTLRLAMPGSNHALHLSHRRRPGAVPTRVWAAEQIAAFARRRGLSTWAVEWDVRRAS